jgi:hypothetical protein
MRKLDTYHLAILKDIYIYLKQKSYTNGIFGLVINRDLGKILLT